MTTITDEMNCGRFEHAVGSIKLQGEFKTNKTNGAIEMLNATVIKSDLMAGNISTTFQDGKIKINMYSVDINDSEEVMTIVNTVVTDLYNKYKVV